MKLEPPALKQDLPAFYLEAPASMQEVHSGFAKLELTVSVKLESPVSPDAPVSTEIFMSNSSMYGDI